MFGLSKKGPTRPFAPADDCKILKADPGVQIPWSKVESGHWVGTCVCGEQHHYAPAPKRTRLDPLDPGTSRHGGMRVQGHDRSLRTSGPPSVQARTGRGLLVGGMRRLRFRLASARTSPRRAPGDDDHCRAAPHSPSDESRDRPNAAQESEFVSRRVIRPRSAGPRLEGIGRGGGPKVVQPWWPPDRLFGRR
jgi:hypothetical protein